MAQLFMNVSARQVYVGYWASTIRIARKSAQVHARRRGKRNRFSFEASIDHFWQTLLNRSGTFVHRYSKHYYDCRET